MNKILISFVAALVATASFAQSTLVATLTHESGITTYYGTTALQAAHKAAVSGDVINLSGGTFQGLNITKAVTIRGNGIDHAYPTIISTYPSNGRDYGTTVNIPSDDSNKFSVEGVRFTCTLSVTGTFSNPSFIKCLFEKQISFDGSSTITNALFANCKTADMTYGCSLQSGSNSSVQFVNCVISGFCNYASATSSASLINCILKYTGNNLNSCCNSQLINCIVCYYNNSGNIVSANAFPTTSRGFNCLTVNYSAPFANSQGAFVDCTSLTSSAYATVFKNYTGAYSVTYPDIQTFELTDEAKTTYLGADGTQVGLYGGLQPYTSTPSYPTINTMKVSKKTTADGKLSVDIEVKAAE